MILVKGNPQYNSLAYETLQLESRFCLALRGIGLHSYQMAEVMSAGWISVVISDGNTEPSLTNQPID